MSKSAVGSAILLVFALAVVPSAQAAFLVNTGPADMVSGGTSLVRNPSGSFSYLAAKFVLGQPETIDSIEGWIGSAFGGTVSLAVYGEHLNIGGSPVPDQSVEYFRQSFSVPDSFSGPPAGWRGVTNMNLSLGPGNYWAAFEVLNAGDFSGGMPGGAPNPLPNGHTAFYTPTSTPGQFGQFSALNASWGFRVNLVPEPSSILLLATGACAFLFARRRFARPD